MVFELREGEVFLLGASSWRADRITPERVEVSPAAGEPGKMPFWHGDRPGRARAFGVRIGQLVQGIAAGRVDAAVLREAHKLDARAADALLTYVREQVAATGEVPSDEAVVVERFVDEVGDWRVVVLCPFGTRVLAPWATAVAARLRERYVDIDLHCTDDGMVFRIPACDEPPPTELFFPSPDAIEDLVTHALDGTALFAARFRECAMRALLLPRRDPRRRTPLWAQRKRAGDLLAVAAQHPEFPIVLETYRECLRDVFDLPGLVGLLRDVRSRRIRVATVDTRKPSPFAASCSSPSSRTSSTRATRRWPSGARRRSASTWRGCASCSARASCALCSIPPCSRSTSNTCSACRGRPFTSTRSTTCCSRWAISSADEVRARCSPPEEAEAWVASLLRAGRAFEATVAGERRFAAIEDAARLRDALGVKPPSSLPPALATPASGALRGLVTRYARTHGPFVVDQLARRLGVGRDALRAHVAALVVEGRLVEGAFLPGGNATELCDRDVLDTLRRKSLAKVRRAIEPVSPRALARFLTDWQGMPRRRRGRDALLAVVTELAGCPLVVSELETEILPARIDGYRAWDLDALCSSGEVVWAGVETLGANDGRIALFPAEQEPLLARATTPVEGAAAAAIRDLLSRRGAVFFADIARAVGGFPNDVLDALWKMVWAGEITNDTLEPLRTRSHAAASESRRPHPRHPRAPRTGPPGSEGRWSLRASRWAAMPGDTDRRTALARALLDRYGVITRETAHAEGVSGGFAAVYDVLKALEDQGRVRRGYFVEGRGGAQFALPGADERLRSHRDADPTASVLVLAATDPGNAYGGVLDWPAGETDARPQRAAGALVVLRDGELLGWMGRGDHPVLTFLPDEEPARTEAAGALAAALAGRVESAGLRALLISTIDGVDAVRSPLAGVFLGAGFSATAQGLQRRARRTAGAASSAVET